MSKLGLEEKKDSKLSQFFSMTSIPKEVEGKEDFDTKIVKIYSWNVNGMRPALSKKTLQNFIKECKWSNSSQSWSLMY